MTRLLALGALIGLATIAGACSLKSGPIAPPPERQYDCPALPSTFAESDLVGTWVAEYGGGGLDTLVLRQDGTYKQIYESEFMNVESEWQDWWVERRKSGYLRVHLHGMRRCDDIEALCARKGGGIGSEMWGIDECENDSLQMSGELVLIASGAPASYGKVPLGVILQHARLSGADSYYSFRRTEGP